MKNAGKLIGSPFLAVVDTDGTNPDKSQCVYIVRDYKVPLGYAAYLLEQGISESYVHNLAAYCPHASIIYNIDVTGELNNYDIIEVNPQGLLHIAYKDASSDNVIFVTNRCNSNCIMCPDTDNNRRKDIGERKEYLKKLINLIPTDTPHLTITGGEPTLLKWDFIDLLQQCRNRFPYTDILMLSNGRTLCCKEYREAFINAIPNKFRLAVPLYGRTADIHDSITRAAGSFDQTVSALRAVQNILNIEIRIVVMQSTYKQLPDIAKFIVNELPHIKTVYLMGIELLGNAAVNRNTLWVDYKETVPYIMKTVQTLLTSGIDVRIYNYPLCSLPH